jgi:O-antigen/teichoic acid export membrane protein
MAGLHSLGRDSLVYGVLDVASRLVSLILVPLYTRALAPADYGALDLVTTFATLVYTVCYLGLDSALAYFFSGDQTDDGRRRTATTGLVTWTALVTLGAAAFATLAPFVARFVVPNVPGAARLLMLAALGLPFLAATTAQTMVLRLRFEMGAYVVLMLGRLVTTIGLTIYMVVGLRRGVEGVLIAQLIANALFAVIAGVVMRRSFAPSVKLGLVLALARYGAPLVLPNVAYWLVLYGERYAIAHFSTVGAVGLFGVATRIAMIITFVSGAIDMAWMPFALSARQRPDAPALFGRVFLYYVLATGIVGTMLALFAREALVLLTQPAYYDAFRLVGPIVAGLILRGALNIVAVGLLLTAKTMRMARISVVAAALDLALLVTLVPVLGALGAAFATCGARLVGVYLTERAAQQVYSIPIAWERITRMTAIFVVVVLVGIYVSALAWPVAVAIKVFVLLPAMACALYFSGAVERSDLIGALQWRRAVS